MSFEWPSEVNHQLLHRTKERKSAWIISEW